jgi:hypothetical protein
MSYILATSLACVHVDDAHMLDAAETLRNGVDGTASHPLAIWQVFAAGAPRSIVTIPGIGLPDPLPTLATSSAPAPVAVPAIASTEPAPAPTSAPADDTAPPSAPAPVVAAGEVDQVAKVRIDAQQAALRAAGVKGIGYKGEGGDGEQFFANGTRMMASGYDTQAARKAEHDAMMDLRDAADALADRVRAEKRRDEVVTAGEVGRSIVVNGKITALDGYALGEHAIRGLLQRIDSDATGYVFGLRERIARLVGEASAAGADRGAILAVAAEDKAKIAEVLQYECTRPHVRDQRVTMRLRDADRDCYATLGPKYSEADAPRAIDRLFPHLPRGAKGSWSYDKASTQWELRCETFTSTPVVDQAVGEAYSAYASFTSRDNGTSRFRGGGGIMLLRCLNASTYAADVSEVARVHRGDVLGDVGVMMRGAMAAITTLATAWGENRETVIVAPEKVTTIEDVIPGFYRHLLRDRSSELVGVLPGKVEEHVTGLTRAFAGERRDADRLVRSDLAQGWTRYVQDQASDVRRDAEAAIGAWLVNGRRVGWTGAREASR